MITAYFDNGRPHVSAHIEIPRLNITGTIPLLVDTGADNPCIHPKDGPELLIPYCTGPDGLKPQTTSSDLWAAIHDTKGPGRPSNQSVSRVMGALGYTSTRVRSTSDRARAWVLINPVAATLCARGVAATCRRKYGHQPRQETYAIGIFTGSMFRRRSRFEDGRAAERGQR